MYAEELRYDLGEANLSSLQLMFPTENNSNLFFATLFLIFA